MKKLIGLACSLVVVLFLVGWGVDTGPLMWDKENKQCNSNVDFLGIFKVGGVTLPAANVTALVAATNANTASAIVKRDSSGNFSAGTITANLTGNASGTAANVTGTVAVANGGTGATTKAAALSALGVARGASSAMTSGAVTVLTTAVEANSIILLTERLGAGFRPMGSVAVDSATAGYGFSITSSSDADTAVVDWAIFTP